MFKHLFWYSLKTFFRDKQGVAFGLFFPLAFSLIYLFVFSGLLTGARALETIPVAFVFDGTPSEVESARQMFSAVAAPAELVDSELRALDVAGGEESESGSDGAEAEVESETEALMHYVEVSEAEAAGLVADSVVSAVVFIDNTDQQLEIALEIAPGATNHFSSSVLYTALSSFSAINLGAQTAFQELINSDQPAQHFIELEQRLNALNQSEPLTVDANIKKGTSSVSLFFYACLAYLCIFYMSIGTNVVTLHEANYSQQALRATISPVKKSTRFFAAFLSFSLPCFIIIYLILIIYYQNDVPLGNDWGRIILLMSLGLLVGLLMGTALASVTKAKPGVLNTLYVAIPLLLGTFSGLMAQELKTFMDNTLPWFNKINPVALINDSLYALNNYPTYRQYNQNMLVLAIIAVVLLAVTLISLRRTDYESI